MCANILHLWLILHISWLCTKLSVSRSRRPSQLVCPCFLVWRLLKTLPAGEQTDHYLERRGESLSKRRKAFFKFYWPSSSWRFFLFSSRLIPSLWQFYDRRFSSSQTSRIAGEGKSFVKSGEIVQAREPGICLSHGSFGSSKVLT